MGWSASLLEMVTAAFTRFVIGHKTKATLSVSGFCIFVGNPRVAIFPCLAWGSMNP